MFVVCLFGPGRGPLKRHTHVYPGEKAKPFELSNALLALPAQLAVPWVARACFLRTPQNGIGFLFLLVLSRE